MKKNRKIFLFGIVAFILLATYIVLGILEDEAIVKKSEYNVTILRKPPLKGYLYEMKDDKMLLVVCKKDTNYRECFSVDYFSGKVGFLGGGSRYTPKNFGKIGIVSNWIYDG